MGYRYLDPRFIPFVAPAFRCRFQAHDLILGMRGPSLGSCRPVVRSFDLRQQACRPILNLNIVFDLRHQTWDSEQADKWA